MVSNWRRNVIDLGLVGEGAGLYARMPNIFLGQFYLSNKVLTVTGTTKQVMAVRLPLGGSDEYTFINLIVPASLHFPYGLVVEPD